MKSYTENIVGFLIGNRCRKDIVTINGSRTRPRQLLANNVGQKLAFDRRESLVLDQEVDHPSLNQIDMSVDQSTVDGHRLVLAQKMSVQAYHLLEVTGRREKQQAIGFLVDSDQIAFYENE